MGSAVSLPFGEHTLPFQVMVLERPDPGGKRWHQALEILLAAGREDETEARAA
jgi:hypothetical protein